MEQSDNNPLEPTNPASGAWAVEPSLTSHVPPAAAVSTLPPAAAPEPSQLSPANVVPIGHENTAPAPMSQAAVVPARHQPGDWVTGVQAWDLFVSEHPELGYSPGLWPFHNFLRHHRDALVRSDALRRAQNRFWIAHVQRFKFVAFECATGTWRPAQHAA